MYTDTAYGRLLLPPPNDTPAILEKKIVNTTIISAGWSTAHAAPSSVCLYRTFTSRHTRKYSSSRCRHSSRKFSDSQPLGGSIVVTSSAAACACRASLRPVGTSTDGVPARNSSSVLIFDHPPQSFGAYGFAPVRPHHLPEAPLHGLPVRPHQHPAARRRPLRQELKRR